MEAREKLEERKSEIETVTGVRPVYNHLLIGKYPLWGTESCGVISKFMLGECQTHVYRLLNDLGKADSAELRQGIRRMMDFGNELTITPPLGNGFVGSRENSYVTQEIHGVFDQRTITELGRLWFTNLQGNVRGLPIDASQDQYEKEIAYFTPPGLSTGENRLFILASTLISGNDAAAGVAPILLDEKFRDSYPEETTLLAGFYYHMVKRRQEQRAGSLYIKGRFPGESQDYRKEAVEKLMGDITEMYGLGVQRDMASRTGSTRCFRS